MSDLKNLKLAYKNNKTLEHIEIISTFVSKLLENQQDLDPVIAQLVDDYFWELIGNPEEY